MADMDKTGLRHRRLTDRPLSEVGNSIDTTLPNGTSSEEDSNASADQNDVTLTNGDTPDAASESFIDRPDPDIKLPIITPEAPVNGREYIEVVNKATQRRELTWLEPKTPYSENVTTVNVESEKISIDTLFNELLRSAGLVGTLVYLGVTIAQANSSGLRSVAGLFAIGQISENLSNILEPIWGATMWFARDPKPRPILSIEGDNVPGVDAFVVCCGEPDDVVMDTVRAACKIDWPAARLRVIVADDGKSSSLREKVEELQAKITNLYYHSRTKYAHKHHGNKAGNLNTTLVEFIANTKQGFSEIIMVIDADMIPSPEILRTLVPHAVQDPNLAMVTCAQFHYNVPNDDPLNQGNTTGTGAEDGNRDRINAAWCPGSGFVLRTAAWASIGGFPEFSITEDLITSWLLHGKGWKIALIPGAMQWGLQPDCLLTHLKQRRRWWTGHIPDAIRFKFALNAEVLQDASFIQRYAMFHHGCRPYLMTIVHAFNTVLTLLCLLIGGPVIGGSGVESLKQVMYSLALVRLVQFIGDVKTVASGGVQAYLKFRRMIATGIWMGHHFSRDVLQSLLPKRLGGKRLGFVVSGVDDHPEIAVKERDATKRPDLITRFLLINQREHIVWHLGLFLVTIALVVYRVCVLVNQEKVGGEFVFNGNFWIHLITSVGFPGLALIDNVLYYLTPILYVIKPPTMPPRREMMEYDNVNEMWKPRKEYQEVRYTAAS